MRPEELFSRAEQRSREAPAPPLPLDASLERLRTDLVAFFDALPEPPVYHRVDDPLRAQSEALASRGEALLARALRLLREDGAAATVRPLADALYAHLETLCHTADGRIDAAELSWRRALELQREASAARRLWHRSDEELPPIYDKQSEVSRYDPRPEPTVTVKLACPNPGCQKIDAYAFSPRHATHRFTCATCQKPFVAYFGEAVEVAVTRSGPQAQHYVFRVEELQGQLTKIEFDEASGAEFSVARRDLLAFLYSADRELKGVLNLTSSRLLWVQRGGPCFLATAAFGDGAPELATFRRFRDEVLLPSSLGAALVREYYRHGAALAAALTRRPRARRFVAWCLRRVEARLRGASYVSEASPSSSQQPPTVSSGAAPAKPRGPFPWIIGAVSALLLGLLLLESVQQARRTSLLPDGTPAPAFTLEKLGGGTVSLDELKGRVVLLDFWATWCPPCREEMPELVKVAKEYEARGVTLVAASRDDDERAKVLVSLFLERAVPALREHTVAFAPEAVAFQYHVDSLPTLYILDREGRVFDSVKGQLSEPAIRRRVEKALEE